ncbi:MAG: hypothetical protein H0U50_00370 [Pyrinomonadaceae bacterium]|nr:hypothetical protein [Pyrinomonadaceae bacterium]
MSINNPGNGYTLIAASGSLTAATSNDLIFEQRGNKINRRGKSDNDD